MQTGNNKKLVILGGAESGVGAALLAVQRGWQVFVSDGGAIKENFKNELDQEGIAYEEGGHTTAKVLEAELVIKSPGISERAEIIKKVRAAGIAVWSELEFGYQYRGDSIIIAITGSNGKSTTTMLTYHLLKDAGYDVALTGNIGISFARQIAMKPCKWYVIEVSSFQLDDIHEFKPDVAVILNITPDHLDRYNYSFDNYAAAKFRITENQDREDYLVLNADDPIIKKFADSGAVRARTIFFTMNQKDTMDEHDAMDDGAFISKNGLTIIYGGERMDISIHDLTLKGKHNQSNSMAAGISARIADIRKEKIRESFTTFVGMEHRLEFVATIKGVDFINDSKATNVNSVWFALESMEKPVVLILGGQDKGNDYTEILELVKEKVRAIICLGADNKAIHDAFDSIVPGIIDTHSAADAVLAAYAHSNRGDVVLLAPACASFDLFKNYEDRGRQFKEAVKAL